MEGSFSCNMKVECSVVLSDNAIAIGGSGLRIFDLETRTEKGVLLPTDTIVFCILLLANGNLVSSSWDKRIKFWDTNLLTCLHKFSPHGYTVTAMAELPNNILAYGFDTGINFLNMEAMEVVAHIPGKALLSVMRSIGITSNNHLVSCHLYGMKMWDTNAMECGDHCVGGSLPSSIYCTIPLPDGRILSGNADGQIRIWDWTTNTCVGMLTGHSGGVSVLSLIDDDRIASGSEDETIKIWRLSSGDVLDTVVVGVKHFKSMHALSTGELIYLTENGTIGFYNTGNDVLLK